MSISKTPVKCPPRESLLWDSVEERMWTSPEAAEVEVNLKGEFDVSLWTDHLDWESLPAGDRFELFPWTGLRDSKNRRIYAGSIIEIEVTTGLGPGIHRNYLVWDNESACYTFGLNPRMAGLLETFWEWEDLGWIVVGHVRTDTPLLNRPFTSQ